jgi:putative thioredoxin
MEARTHVFGVTPQTFQTDVIERSREAPVLLLFWAEQVRPSAQTRQLLETMVTRYQGKVWLGLVDVSREQTLAQHLRVQTLPSVRVIRDGQIVEQLDGPQGETTFQRLLDALTLSSSDLLRAQLDECLDQGDFEAALNLLEQAIGEEPANQAFRVELADVYVRLGRIGAARQVLAAFPEETEGRDGPVARLEFVEEAGALAPRSELEAAHARDPADLDTCYALCVARANDGAYEEALELALSILERNRKFRDDAGRTVMIRIFRLLPKGSELAGRYRRRMFNFMH